MSGARALGVVASEGSRESRAVARRQGLGRRADVPVPLGWFVLIVVFGGVIDVALQAMDLGSMPIQLGGRVLLVCLVLVALAKGAGRMGGQYLPRGLRYGAFFFVSAPIVSLLIALARDSDSGEALSSYNFMYSIGVLLLVPLLVPVSIRFGVIFRVLALVVMLFAVAQIVRQDLLLSDDRLQEIGVAYSRFINGRIRAISLFASAPRLAEFATLVALLLQYRLTISLRGAKRVVAAIIYIGVVLVIFNTYSRSGIVLYVCGTLTLLFMTKERLRGGKGPGRSGVLLILVAGSLPIVYLLAFGLPGQGGIADSTSLAARQAHWEDLFGRSWFESTANLFFGPARSGRLNALDPDQVVVDNVFLAVMLFGGLLGLAAFLFFAGALIRSLASIRRERADVLEPLLAFFLALLVEGFFVDNHNTLFLAALAGAGYVAAHGRLSDQVSPVLATST